MTYYSNLQYYSCLLILLFYAGTIPYTRFLMGVHSLDQIVFGMTLGLWVVSVALGLFE